MQYVAGSSPAGRPCLSNTGRLPSTEQRHATLYRARAGSNPARPANLPGSGGREARHWIVDPDHASSSLVRSAFRTCAASSTGTSTRLLSGGLRVRVPRGASASITGCGVTFRIQALGACGQGSTPCTPTNTRGRSLARLKHRPATPGTWVQIPPFTPTFDTGG